ncbi:MAG TPA: threonine/serine dehydratase [Gemmatimonadales bacterium]|nr:threonine/serine dehydratase [Gemmatimonadales bacterium]
MTLPPAVDSPVTLDTIRAAERALQGVAVRTPMVEVARRPLYLKCEHLQPIGAFKIRGAYTALDRLGPAGRAGGVVTNSSGNHGQAVAWAAHRFGVRSVVVMPESAPGVKVAGVQRWGGEVVLAGKTRSPEQQARTDQIVAEQGLAFVPAFDHADVIAGQGTAGLEILDQVPEVATLLVPVGGGGLLAGITAAIKALKPGVEIVGVEPAGAPKLSRALEGGRPVTLPATQSLADGLLTRAIGTLPWSVIRPHVHRAVTVTDEEISAAVRWLFEHQGLRVEPSGAVTVAAVLAGKAATAAPTVAVLSGGNVDPELFARLVAA